MIKKDRPQKQSRQTAMRGDKQKRVQLGEIRRAEEVRQRARKQEKAEHRFSTQQASK
jgi:hypothetical protein